MIEHVTGQCYCIINTGHATEEKRATCRIEGFYQFTYSNNLDFCKSFIISLLFLSSVKGEMII